MEQGKDRYKGQIEKKVKKKKTDIEKKKQEIKFIRVAGILLSALLVILSLIILIIDLARWYIYVIFSPIFIVIL